VFENSLGFSQHTAQEEMNTLALHGMVFMGHIAVEILPTDFSVLPPNVAVSD
jgi:hypothetical protein